MTLYKISESTLKEVQPTTFVERAVWERRDLQEMLKRQIHIIAPDTLVVAEEFGEWQDSRRRIDLLGIDRDANLVVIELKRTEDGGHMELQSIRYAAMISTLTFEKLVDIFSTYMKKNEIVGDASEELLNFLGWSDPDEDNFAQRVKIVLASAEFSKELTTSVMWLNETDNIDISCVKMIPYVDRGETFIDFQQIIPIPEAKDYQVRLKKKRQKEQQAKTNSRDVSRINIYYNDALVCREIRKADIGLMTVLTLQENNLLDDETFDFLKTDRTCRFDLIKSKDQVVENEEKYNRYRVTDDPEFEYGGTGYYVARNWGRPGAEKFKVKMEDHFKGLKFEFVD